MAKRNFLENLGFTDDFISLSLHEKPLKSSRYDSLQNTYLFREDKAENVFFIKKDVFRKVGSDGNIENLNVENELLKEKRVKEYEDIYDLSDSDHPLLNEDHDFDGYDKVIQDDSNLSGCMEENSHADISHQHMMKFQKIIHSLNDEFRNNQKIIKAYQSKLKMKHLDVYLENSKLTKEINKVKIYHKCNFPECGRTFSSSGWLKSHLEEHIKEIKTNAFNINFENKKT